MDKYSLALQSFWGAAFFAGLLSSIILGFNSGNWIFAGSTGICVFLILGLVIQGLLTLLKKQ